MDLSHWAVYLLGLLAGLLAPIAWRWGMRRGAGSRR